MKPKTPHFSLLTLVLAALAFLWTPARAAEPPFDSVNWNTWSWTAPEPPLPDTQWWDYGWDSTSNGPAPAGGTELSTFNVERSTLNVQGRGPAPIQFAQLKVAGTAPFPPAHAPALVAASRESAAVGASDQRRSNEAPLQKQAATAPQEARVPVAEAPRASKFYFDSFVTARTPDFKNATYGYGLGAGLQISPHWGADVRLTHQGFDADGSVVQDIGGRLVARMPFKTLSPYSFLGGTFDLERDEWRLQPGGGIEIGKLLFVEGGLDANLRGRNGYKFGAGIRLRF